MSYTTRLFQREPEQVDHPIGLGWLLAIALCGGILLFTTVGLLLVWWIKKSRSPGPQMVYTFAAAHNSGLPPSSSRLTKRRLLGSESFSKLSSRFSSRFSFVGPPEPPTLPTHESFQLPERRRTVSRGRKRSRSWVDEDDMHGPRMARSKRNARESWLGRDGWHGMAPTLPNVDAVPEEVEMQAEVPLQHPQPRWLPRSQTDPRLTSVSNSTFHPDGVPNGVIPIGPMRISVPPPAHIRSSVTDSNLKGILRSTEMRLSERKSQSPIKAPRPTAVNGSPTKSPRSHRSHHTASSGPSNRGLRVSGSPPKRGPSHKRSGNNSASTVGSAANSLIAAATQELVLPGGISSPSKVRGTRREKQQQQQEKRIVTGSPERVRSKTVQTQSLQKHSPQRHSPQRQKTHIAMMMIPQMQATQMQFSQLQYPKLPLPYVQHHSMPPVQQRSPKRSPERRTSFDSDKSSSLSTLYSTNEPEEERPRQRQVDDPFVEKGGPRRWPSWQARQRPANVDSQRRAKTLSSSSSLTRFMVGEPSCPPPLRPISAISQPDISYGGLMSPLMLEPQPTEYPINGVAFETDFSQIPYIPQAPSEVSFVSVSVDSDVTEVPANETARVDWIDSSDSASSSPTTPTGKTKFPDMSSPSSPYDEREIMSLLMATASPHRALPLPPPGMTGPDGSIVAILSPAPRGGLTRQASTASSTYTFDSFLADQAGALTASPSRRSIQGPRLSTAIAELRRMNSVLSTYSVASLASTVPGEGDSPTLPASISGGGGLAKSQSIRFSSASIGSRHYLNVGNTRPMIGHRYGTRGGSRHRRSDTCHYGKDGQGLGLRLSCIVDEALDDLQQQRHTQSLNLSYKPTIEIIEGIPTRVLNQKFGPMEELIEAEQRQDLHRASIESLGLYDKDGFLLSSPERDAKRQRLRA